MTRHEQIQIILSEFWAAGPDKMHVIPTATRILEITKVEVKGEDVAIAEAQWNGMPIEHWHKHIAFIDGSLEEKHSDFIAQAINKILKEKGK